MRWRHSFGCSLEEIFNNAEDEQMACCLQEHWRFDRDDPMVAPEGAEEQDCMLVAKTRGICGIWQCCSLNKTTNPSIMTLQSTFCKMAAHMLSPHFKSLLHCQFAKTHRMSSADLQMASRLLQPPNKCLPAYCYPPSQMACWYPCRHTWRACNLPLPFLICGYLVGIFAPLRH